MQGSNSQYAEASKDAGKAGKSNIRNLKARALATACAVLMRRAGNSLGSDLNGGGTRLNRSFEADPTRTYERISRFAFQNVSTILDPFSDPSTLLGCLWNVPTVLIAASYKTSFLIAAVVHFETWPALGICNNDNSHVKCVYSYCPSPTDFDDAHLDSFTNGILGTVWEELCEGFSRNDLDELQCTVPDQHPFPNAGDIDELQKLCASFLKSLIYSRSYCCFRDPKHIVYQEAGVY